MRALFRKALSHWEVILGLQDAEKRKAAAQQISPAMPVLTQMAAEARPPEDPAALEREFISGYPPDETHPNQPKSPGRAAPENLIDVAQIADRPENNQRDASHHGQRAAKLNAVSKILLAVCAALLLTVIYLSREQVSPAGPRNMFTMVRNPWTGTIVLCAPYGGECRQTYPPTAAQEPPSVSSPLERPPLSSFDSPPQAPTQMPSLVQTPAAPRPVPQPPRW